MQTAHFFASSFFLFISCILPICGFGQCPEDDVVFRSQADIDAFKIQYPNCQNLKENLFIVSSEDIVDLSGLTQIRTIRLQLFVRGNEALVNFNGLDSLFQIGTDLVIENNPVLQNLQGLAKLTHIGTDCMIESNPILGSLQGLDALETVGGNLWLFWDDALSDLTGLGSLREIGQSLLVKVNENLQSFTGIGSLDSLGGSLDINSNPNLIDFSGLESLRVIDGFLQVEECPKLKNLQGLNTLEKVGKRLILLDNPSLENLVGLESLRTIEDGLLIWRNPQIKNCLGLDAIETIYGYGLSVQGCDEFSSADGLQTLAEASTVQFRQCPKLSSLGGFDNLSHIYYGLYIASCPLLSNFKGMDRLARIDGSLVLVDNQNLSKLSGLEFLGRNSLSILGIVDNPVLDDISALERVASIDTIFINNNLNLSQCEIQAICNLLETNPDYLSIANNQAGCNTHEEIKMACEQKPALDQFEYRLFPNPSQGVIRLEQNEEFIFIHQIDIVDLRGSLVYRRKRAEFDFFDYFDLRHFQAGLYYVILYTDSGEKRLEKLLLEFE